ncbi:MAG: citryl-CoA lyase [Alphaproteobacteria bacterium CG_4_10_14_0_2_um_filter_63_37]|nr:MAG: citryl-CoA lyase [Proteobacteria bacterium CG1_02_64_396]PJA24033.1 MAG: citryl-CoA lyase [Alphaproteobacteria bacterium CG_4_10_14_0_2_um_filter_63_37]
MSLHWRTAITKNEAGEIHVRGYDVMDLAGNLRFGEAIYLILKGELPSAGEAAMMDAIFVSMIDAGIAPPSVVAARTVFSGGNSYNSSVAAGILTLGDYHGGAIEQCAKTFGEVVDAAPEGADMKDLAKKTVAEFAAIKRRFPGYGHKIHKEGDPRTVRLLEVAKKHGFGGRYIDFATAVGDELAKSGKQLPLNVDGAVAAVICDMGFDWRMGKAFFLIARVPGLCAHVFEEWMREKPFRRLPSDQHEYDGTEDRSLPEAFVRG